MGDTEVGRWSDLHSEPEVTDLTNGLDFRHPRYRREVFLRFYDFHLTHRSHPGCVYYLMPALQDHYHWTVEQAYWWAFINGNTQHPLTSSLIWREFPELADVHVPHLQSWFDARWYQLDFDTDRRYWKAQFVKAVERYIAVLDGRTQAEFFGAYTGDPRDAFTALWADVRGKFHGFGRLSAWSYIEYLRILGLDVEPPDLMLRDIDGSRSHRNGLCIVLGRDDLDWKSKDAAHPYTRPVLDWLAEEAAALIAEAKARFSTREFVRDVTHLTLESTLCCYKGWHRPNRRYPNVYNDMLHDRIRRVEKAWRNDPLTSLFWQLRARQLPKSLRLEDNALDVGLAPQKQNHYLTTGQVVMMETFDPVFTNDYTEVVRGLYG